MANNKKIKAPVKKQSKTKPKTATFHATDNQERKASFQRAPQMISMLTISIAAGYLYETYLASIQDESVPCSKYLIDTDTKDVESYNGGCTTEDIFFIKLKLHSMSVMIALFTFATILCWNNDGLLRRLASIVSISPFLVNIVVFMFLSRGVLHQRTRSNLTLVSAVLFAITGNIGKGIMAPKIGYNRASPVDTVLMLSMLMEASEVSLMLLVDDGIGFIAKDIDSLSASRGSKFLSRLVAVDKASVVFLLSFVLFYFDHWNKKVSWCHFFVTYK